MRIKSLLVVAILAIAIFGFGGIVNAQSADVQAQIASLQAMIQSLLQQIATLQAQQGTTTPIAWCHTFNTNLGFANSGSDEVGALHTILGKEGASYAPDTGNTYYEGTSHAVIQFQTKYGILQSGYVGPLTRAKLNVLYGCSATPSCSTLYWSDSSNTTCSAQKQFCGAYMYQGLHTFTTQQACLSSLQPSITVTSPNGGEFYQLGSWMQISFIASNIPVGTHYEIDLVSSNNNEWIINNGEIISGGGGTQGLRFGIPPAGTTNSFPAGNYKIRVSYGTGNTIIQDLSDNYFSIVTPVACLNGSGPLLPGQSYCNSTQPSITVTSPNGGETLTKGSTVNIRWNSSNVSNIYIKLRKGNDTYTGYEGAITPWIYNQNNGYYSWTIPTTLPNGSDYSIRVLDSATLILDDSNSYFTIAAPTTQPSITVTSPNGGENWKIGETHNITARFVLVDKYNIIAKNIDNGSSYSIGEDLFATSPFSWVVGRAAPGGPGMTPGRYKIEIFDDSNSGAIDTSDNYFTISAATTQPAITVTSPNGGENWKVGETHNITWTSSNFGSMGVSINLLKPGATGAEYLRNIASNLPNTGTYQWTIPSIVSSGTYNLMLVSSGGVAVQDYSNNYFNIATASTIPCLSGSGPLLPGQLYCTTQLPICTSFTYSVWGACSPSGTQTRTATPFSPVGCVGGSPILTQPCVYTAPASITVTSPAGTSPITIKSTQNITWTTSGVKSSYVSIGFYGQAGNFLGNITTQTANDGSYSWTIPVTVTNGTYRIRVSEYGNAAVYGESSNLVFAVAVISPVSPASGNNFAAGSTQNIAWTTSGIDVVPYVRLDLYLSTTFIQTITSRVDNTGFYSWTIPVSLSVSNNYTIKISSYTDGVVRGDTGSFSISAPTVVTCTNFTYSAWSTCSLSGTQTRSVTTFSPSGCTGGNPILSQSCTAQKTITIATPYGLPIAVNSVQNISWSTTGTSAITYVKIDLYKAGTFLKNITAKIANNGNYNWTIPATLSDSSDYKIRISEYGNSSVYVDSVLLNIYSVSKGISVTSPSFGVALSTGSTQTITWTTRGTTPITYVTIKLYYTGTNILMQTITSRTANNGTFSWKIPTNLASGSVYKVRVSEYGNSSVYGSTGYFSINSSPPSLPGAYNYSNNNLASLSDALEKIMQELQSMLNK